MKIVMPFRFVFATTVLVFAAGLVVAQNAEASKKPKNLDSSVQQDNADPIPLLSCHFESEGKAGTVCEATLTLVAPPRSVSAGSPPNQFIVRCDDEVVYDGGAFFNSVALSPDFASSVIAANTGITPTYPAIWVTAMSKAQALSRTASRIFAWTAPTSSQVAAIIRSLSANCVAKLREDASH